MSAALSVTQLNLSRQTFVGALVPAQVVPGHLGSTLGQGIKAGSSWPWQTGVFSPQRGLVIGLPAMMPGSNNNRYTQIFGNPYPMFVAGWYKNPVPINNGQ